MLQKRLLLALVAAVLVIGMFPVAATMLLWINLALLILLSSLSLLAGGFAFRSRPHRAFRPRPKVSIHVPIHAEPPAVVRRTLMSLADIDYPEYEVIVLDNNTEDASLWEPIRDLCDDLGARFRFSHEMDVQAFKAGALNRCLAHTDDDAEFIAVVDADYEVSPAFLNDAMQYFADPQTALVQFPQAYKNVSKANLGMMRDFQHFFLFHMNMADHFDSAISTGTLSIYRKDALLAIGGWPTTSLTEDAAAGLELLLAGYHSRYVNIITGRGLMPDTLADYRIQRDRWIAGNAQLLKEKGFHILSSDRLSLPQKLSVLGQLTAWFDLMLIPLVLLPWSAMLVLFSPAYEPVLWLSGASLLVYLATKALTFTYGFLAKRYILRDAIAGFVTHLGLVWDRSTSWIRALMEEHLRFARTNKFIGDDDRSASMTALIGAAALIAFGLLHMVLQDSLAPVFLVLLAALVLSIAYVDQQLSRTRALTRRMV